MQFSVSESIHALKGKLYEQSFPLYSSTPADDLVNPGYSFNLYSDIVPVNGHTSPHNVQAKGNEILTSQSVENQTGSGLTAEQIQHSFQHPRPIKTEVLHVKKTPTKRQNQDFEGNGLKKSKKNNHKFQFV